MLSCQEFEHMAHGLTEVFLSVMVSRLAGICPWQRCEGIVYERRSRSRPGGAIWRSEENQDRNTDPSAAEGQGFRSDGVRVGHCSATAVSPVTDGSFIRTASEPGLINTLHPQGHGSVEFRQMPLHTLWSLRIDPSSMPVCFSLHRILCSHLVIAQIGRSRALGAGSVRSFVRLLSLGSRL